MFSVQGAHLEQQLVFNDCWSRNFKCFRVINWSSAVGPAWAVFYRLNIDEFITLVSETTCFQTSKTDSIYVSYRRRRWWRRGRTRSRRRPWWWWCCVERPSCSFIPEPWRASANQSSWWFVQLSCQLLISPEAMMAFSQVTRPYLRLSDWLKIMLRNQSAHVVFILNWTLVKFKWKSFSRSQICQDTF